MGQRKQVEIRITQTIQVDPCIADEIAELNNTHNIDTMFSCCGHGGQGYIIVRDLDIQKMLDIGYKRIWRRYLNTNYYVTDNRKVKSHEYVQWVFKSKSKCTGQCEQA